MVKFLSCVFFVWVKMILNQLHALVRMDQADRQDQQQEQRQTFPDFTSCLEMVPRRTRVLSQRLLQLLLDLPQAFNLLVRGGSDRQFDRADFLRVAELGQVPPVFGRSRQRRKTAGQQAQRIGTADDQPLRLRPSRMPSACRRQAASRATVRETPYSSANWASVMRNVPSADCSPVDPLADLPGKLLGFRRD